MNRACLTLFFLAIGTTPVAHAQFTLFVVEGTTEKAAPSVYDFGSLYAGESSSAHFRLRNTSSAPATLSVLTVAGVGFGLTAPDRPIGVAPGNAVDLSVTFGAADTGAYSAALRAEGIAILLTATVVPRLTYTVDPPSSARFPGPLDFGSVVPGSSVRRRIVMQNQTQQVLTVPAIGVLGADFALVGTPPSGQALAPLQGGDFTIAFTPHSRGASAGTLTLGDRTYPLLGTGSDPPLPKPSLSLNLPRAASAQQGELIVRFDAPAAGGGMGTATMDFLGSTDSGISFASGGRSATFPIAPGDVQAVLPFQTGTSAGVLTFTAQIGSASDQRSVTIAAAAPGITAVQGVRSSSSLEVLITGYDNTRSLGALSFTFYDANGNAIGPGAIGADASGDFAKYFAGSDLGGVFLLRAVFPVGGDATQVASCEATLANSAGSAKTQRTSF
jgi:hypothetical protein